MKIYTWTISDPNDNSFATPNLQVHDRCFRSESDAIASINSHVRENFPEFCDPEVGGWSEESSIDTYILELEDGEGQVVYEIHVMDLD